MDNKLAPSERDLLIRLDETVAQLKEEIKSLHESINSSLLDHEARLRVAEKAIDRADGALKVVYVAFVLVFGILASLWYVKH